MKLKIDTSAKTIQVEQMVKLVELIEFVKKIFPNNEWKDYSIEAVQYIDNWYNPIYIPCLQPYQPYQPFTFTGMPSLEPISDTTEIYCFEIN